MLVEALRALVAVCQSALLSARSKSKTADRLETAGRKKAGKAEGSKSAVSKQEQDLRRLAETGIGEATAVAQGLQQLVQHLSQCPLNGSEKRQLAEGSKAAEKLKEKLTYGQVEEDVIVQCNRLVSAVLQRDYATASAVQVALVNSHWAAHKDWLKGVKFLCQLAQKKMQ